MFCSSDDGSGSLPCGTTTNCPASSYAEKAPQCELCGRGNTVLSSVMVHSIGLTQCAPADHEPPTPAAAPVSAARRPERCQSATSASSGDTPNEFDRSRFGTGHAARYLPRSGSAGWATASRRHSGLSQSLPLRLVAATVLCRPAAVRRGDRLTSGAVALGVRV